MTNYSLLLSELKQKILNSHRTIISGIDVGKSKHCAAFILSNGKIIQKKFIFDNSREGFNLFWDKIKSIKEQQQTSDAIFTLEPSSYYWKYLFQFLQDLKQTTVVVSPLAVSRNRETINLSKDKSDPKDAYNIADLTKQGKFYLHSHQDKQIAQLRQYVNLYSQFTKEKTIFSIRLRNAVSYVFPEIEKYFSDIRAKTLLLILKKFSTPKNILSYGKTKFIKYLKKHNPYFPSKRSAEIYDLALNSIGIRDEDTAICDQINIILTHLEYLDSALQQITQRIHQLISDRQDYRLLRTIPGIGFITASCIIAEIGNINNFSSFKQIIKFCGLDIVGKKSGSSIDTPRHISKNGRILFRTSLYQAALSCIKYALPLKIKYHQIIEKHKLIKKQKKKALVIIMAKLVRIIFRMLKDNEPFNPYQDQITKQKYIATGGYLKNKDVPVY